MTRNRPDVLNCLDYPTVRELRTVFDGATAMFDCVQSDNGKAGAKDVMNFADDIIHMMFAKV